MAVLRVTVHIAVVLIFIVAPSQRSVFICSIIRGAAKVKRGEGRKKPRKHLQTKQETDRNNTAISSTYLFSASTAGKL